MYPFAYCKAGTVEDAATLLVGDPDARLLAGGQSLVPAMKMRLASPSKLVDLGAIAPLRGIAVDGNAVTLGAMTRHREVAESAEVRRALPALAALAAGIGDRMVRNMGTCGGSIALSDPAADYPAACLGLGATIVTNRRRHEADGFFRAMYETALEPGEIIASVEFPIPRRAAYAKFRNPASRYAIVGVFVADFGDGRVRVAVTGAASSVFRVSAMEAALSQRFAADAIESIRIPAAGLNADLHADAEYRAHLVTVMARRAVDDCMQR